MTRAITYPFSIDTHGRVSYTQDPRKIWQDRVRAVINTQVGDRVMRPGFGVNTEAAVMNYGTPAQDELITNIKAAFTNQLPSLNVQNITAGMDDTSGALTVEIWFTLPDRTLTSTSVTYDQGTVVQETNPFEVY